MDHSNDFPRVEVDSKGDILHLIKTLKQVTTDKLAAKAEKRRANEQQVELAKQLVEEWVDELFRLASSNIAVNGFDYQDAFRDVEEYEPFDESLLPKLAQLQQQTEDLLVRVTEKRRNFPTFLARLVQDAEQRKSWGEAEGIQYDTIEPSEAIVAEDTVDVDELAFELSKTREAISELNKTVPSLVAKLSNARTVMNDLGLATEAKGLVALPDEDSSTPRRAKSVMIRRLVSILRNKAYSRSTDPLNTHKMGNDELHPHNIKTSTKTVPTNNTNGASSDGGFATLPDNLLAIIMDALQIGMRGYVSGMCLEAVPRLLTFRPLKLIPDKRTDHVAAKVLLILMAGFRLLNRIAQTYVALDEKRLVALRMWLRVKLGWKGSSKQLETMIKTFASAAIASYAAVQLIPTDKRVDLVFFTAVRAIDVLFSVFHAHDKLALLLPQPFVDNGDVLLFTTSCSVIMFCWFYVPSALPDAYNRWILKMSELDHRILEALRAIRCGALQYGKEFGPRELFSGFAESVGYPAEAADAFLVPQVPCEIVHGGTKSCTAHKALIWQRNFLKSVALYTPGHMMPVLILHPRSFISRLPHMARDVVRSASFLATFIALQWSAICLLRNSLPAGMADSHAWGPMIGSLCGLSILIEKKSRRKELGLFVAPRAIYALLHMIFVVGIRNLWTGNHYKQEIPLHAVNGRVRKLVGEVLFSSSVGVLVTSYLCRHDAMRRGWLSSVLKWLIEG